MHGDLPNSRQMKTTGAWQYWIIQYFRFFTAARGAGERFFWCVLWLHKLLLHQDLTFVFKQIYRVKNFPLSLLFSEHGQKLGTSKASYPKQGICVAVGPRKAGCLHKGWVFLWKMGETSGMCSVAAAVCRKIPSPAWAVVFRVQYMGGFFMLLNGRSWSTAVINTINCQEI